jgi:hypothetical protein
VNAELTRAVCLAGPAGITLQHLRELFDLLDTRRFERGLVQLWASGAVVETTEQLPNRAGGVQPQVVLRCR